MVIFLNWKNRQMSNFQDMMSQMTLGSLNRKEKHSKAVVINGRIVEKNAYFWRAPGKPMRVGMDTDNSVNTIKCIHFSTKRL